MGKSEHRSKQRSRRQQDNEGGRTVRLQELIREEVNFLLRCEISDARLEGVVATFVELSGDGSRARIWFTAEGETDRGEALDRAAGFLRNHLAESLALKRTPELRFRRDPTTRTMSPPAGAEPATPPPAPAEETEGI